MLLCHEQEAYVSIMSAMRFEWDRDKNQENQRKHGVAFEVAQYAFADARRVIAEDVTHSRGEQRYFCFGRVGKGVLTVRFTVRGDAIRIFGAGYWRKGKKIYEQENGIQRRADRRGESRR